MEDELILAVPWQVLFPSSDDAFQGLRRVVEPYLTRIASGVRPVRRAEAEVDPSLKQPIPYVVVTAGARVFATERLPGQGEVRLHGKLSLGLGGHMNPQPGTWEQVLAANLGRELNEEVELGSPYELTPLGLVNDDTVEVGRYHIGLLYRAELTAPVARVREGHKLRGEWLSLAEVRAVYDRLESWSQFVADLLLAADAFSGQEA